jgi:phage baseplate assembly protein W
VADNDIRPSVAPAPLPTQRRPGPPPPTALAVPAYSPELDPAPLTATIREVVDFIGRGLAWPMRVDQSGSISLTNGAADLDSSVRLILLTAPGERLMRPEFGCRIHELVFEPINANTLGLMRHAVRQALAQWEPRITVEDVDVETDPNTSGLVQIHLGYRVRATNDRRNLVHPFYLIPHEGEPTAKGTT